MDPSVVERAFTELEEAGAAELAALGLTGAATAYLRELELRYAGQGFALSVPAGTPFDARARAAALEAFHARHRAVYGFAAEGEAVEAVTARSTAIGLLQHERQPDGSDAAAGEAPVAGVDAMLEHRAGMPVYARERLPAGASFAGPAVVEQYDATTFVAGGWRATLDALGNLILETG
jgi:N-methylhydantoinase A